MTRPSTSIDFNSRSPSGTAELPCRTGDQVKLYSNYPNWQTELALPSLEMEMLAYLRRTVIHAWECTLFPTPGVVHLNVPFRDPLASIPQPGAEALKSEFSEIDFFTGIANIDPTLLPAQAVHPGARPEVRIGTAKKQRFGRSASQKRSASRSQIRSSYKVRFSLFSSGLPKPTLTFFC